MTEGSGTAQGIDLAKEAEIRALTERFEKDQGQLNQLNKRVGELEANRSDYTNEQYETIRRSYESLRQRIESHLAETQSQIEALQNPAEESGSTGKSAPELTVPKSAGAVPLQVGKYTRLLELPDEVKDPGYTKLLKLADEANDPGLALQMAKSWLREERNKAALKGRSIDLYLGREKRINQELRSLGIDQGLRAKEDVSPDSSSAAVSS